MSKYIVETFYTCTFKIIHKLNELNEKKLSDLENRDDGKVQIIDVKLNNRKTKTADQKENFENSQNKIETKKYSIETLMTNNRSSGGYFSKDATKLLYSSDKSGIFNVYEMDLTSNKETQITDSKLESYFAISYSPLTNEIIYVADSGGNENFHLFLIRGDKTIDLTPGKNTKDNSSPTS